jgi:class 3 adenylate cyclase/ketosteroid isomerase-like protein
MDDRTAMKRDRELEAQILAFAREYNESFARHDLGAIMSLFSPDVIGFMSGAHERIVGGERMKALMAEGLAETERAHRDFRLIAATRRGSLIIFALEYDIHAVVEGRPMSSAIRWTGVLEPHDGRFRCVETHASLPAPDQPEGRAWPAPVESLAFAVSAERPDLRAQAAPNGTVTLLFTDVEDSTVMMERLGDPRWLDLLRAHNTIVREQVETHGCFEVKSQGDGFMIASQSARRGMQCAIDIQRAFARYNKTAIDPLHVRIGLHTGEVLKDAQDFFGKHVILASRIANEARGGQIVVSSLLKEITESGGDFSFDRAREVHLRGLSGSYRIHEVRWREGDSEPQADAVPTSAHLTAREVEILGLIAEGRTNAEISLELSLSARTVARHITNIYDKIGARSKADATAYAIRHHLTPEA